MKTLRFSRLELTNWRNFKSVDVPLASRTFVVGPNAIGKSNLLDAFRFLRDLALEGGGLAKAVSVRNHLASIRSLHARGANDICIAVEVTDSMGTGWRYELAFNHRSAKQTRPIVKREQVWKLSAGGERIEVLPKRPRPDEKSDDEQLAQTALQQATQNKDFRELSEFLRSVSYLHIVPQLVREEQRPREDAVGFDPFGRDLLDRIADTPKAQRTQRLKDLEKILKRVVPQMRGLKQTRDRQGRPHLETNFIHWRGFGATQNETQFSDGTLRLIGLLWSLQESGAPLLLEEPELSLHSHVVSKLAGFIHRAQETGQGRQVIVSTHSEHLLSDAGIAPEEILLVTPVKEGSAVESGAKHARVSRLMKAGLLPSEAVIPETVTKGMDLFQWAAA